MLLANPHRVLAGLSVAATLSFAACGGDDDPVQTTAPAVTGAETAATSTTAEMMAAPEDEPAADPRTDRDAITRTLETVLTSDDPDRVCEELVTENYVREAYGDAAGCRRAQQDARTASAVSVSRVVVSPESVAQASVRPDGGLYAGERLRAELVLDSGTWKVDSLRSNVPVGP